MCCCYCSVISCGTCITGLTGLAGINHSVSITGYIVRKELFLTGTTLFYHFQHNSINHHNFTFHDHDISNQILIFLSKIIQHLRPFIQLKNLIFQLMVVNTPSLLSPPQLGCNWSRGEEWRTGGASTGQQREDIYYTWTTDYRGSQ